MSYKNVFTPFRRRFTDEAVRDLSDVTLMYHHARRNHTASVWSHPGAIDDWVNRIQVGIQEDCLDEAPYPPLNNALRKCLRELLALETTIFSFPEIDWSRAKLSMKEQVDLSRFLTAKQHFLANQTRISGLLFKALINLSLVVLAATRDQLTATTGGVLTVPLISLVPHPKGIIDALIEEFTKTELAEAGLFSTLQDRIVANIEEASGIVPGKQSTKQMIVASESDLTVDEAVRAYLAGTPLYDLLNTPVPFVLPESARFEHQWMVAGTGHGKTNALANLILDDLQRVADGGASVVVIDSQNSLIPSIAGLKYFAPGEALDGKLVLIDPTDIEYPVALNLFDMGLQRLSSYSPLDRERLLNTAAEVMQFVLASLLGAEMTSRQSTLFGYALQAMQLIPDATIHTFRELMQPNGTKKYAPYLENLEGRAREFFDTQFDAPIFAQTKQQVVARLFAVCENRTFDRMLSNSRSKLDLFSEMNSGKVILINTAKDLLKQQGTEIFGRFFLALIAQAAQERATIHPSLRLPCYVYIDECQDYLSTDSNFTVILEQARKQNIGMIVAHQYLTQLSQHTLDSLYANTSIKCAGGLSDKDAHALARNMQCQPAFLSEQPRGSFATYIRNATKNAIALKFPFTPMHKWPQMTANDKFTLRDRMRDAYAVHQPHFSMLPPRSVKPEEPVPAVPPSPPELDVDSSEPSKWPL